MQIKGLQKTTLLDFPGKVACTVFTGGCNFRCPFCHNASLVLSPREVTDIPEEEFFSFLEKRKGILDGVCITGGEPLLHSDILPFVYRIHSMGYSVKVDTNGSFPEVLKRLVDSGTVDYIAMDIKNVEHKYSSSVGIDNTTKAVFESIDFIMKSGVDYEFRTTVAKELHTPQDIVEIAKRINGAKNYFLQCYNDSGDVIDPSFSAYSAQEMAEMLEIVRPYVQNCDIRGV